MKPTAQSPSGQARSNATSCSPPTASLSFNHNYLLQDHDFLFNLSWEQIKAKAPDTRSLRRYLSEVGHLRSSSTGRLFLDLKSGFQPRLLPHEALAKLLQEEGWINNAVMLDWDFEQIAELRGRHQSLLLGAAIRGRIPNLDQLLTDTAIDYLYLDWDLMRPEDVETSHAKGVAVGTLEGWHASFYERVTRFGVDYVLASDTFECAKRLRKASDRYAGWRTATGGGRVPSNGANRERLLIRTRRYGDAMDGAPSSALARQLSILHRPVILTTFRG